jgi:hypothetical protein
MNINGVRKNYANLTMLQRLALADNALGRGDESEALAIKNASPRVSYTAADFTELLDEILRFRLCNLITRLGYIMSFDVFLAMEADLDILKDESKVKQRKERISKDLRLAAYLYVRATDSWNAVNSELGLRSNFDDEIGEHLFAIDLLKSRDSLMREWAFSETEARKYLAKSTGNDKLATLAEETEAIREALNIKDL